MTLPGPRARPPMRATLPLLAVLSLLGACSSSTLSENETFAIQSAFSDCGPQQAACQIVSITPGQRPRLDAPDAQGITLHCQASCFAQGGGQPQPSYEQVYCITLGSETRWRAVLYFRTPGWGRVDGFLLPVGSPAAFGQAGCASAA